MKKKIVLKTRKEVDKWINTTNVIAKSLISSKTALNQFNKLNSVKRTEIKEAFNKYDKIRRIKIPNGDTDPDWNVCIMVDAHIIATEYDIDPLTAVMCVNPICNSDERIIVKK